MRFLFQNFQIKCVFRYNVNHFEVCAGFPNSDGTYKAYQGAINFGAALICYQKSDPTKPILTGIATRKDLSPSKDSPGVYTDVFKIKKSIQDRLGILDLK